MKNTFEVHIAAPRLTEERTSHVRDVLASIGLSKTKYFQGVRDIIPITPGCLNGHDLKDPGTMSTIKVFSIEEAVRFVRLGMEKLRELGINGTNFEIERIMVPDDDSSYSFSTEDTLPDFQDVPNAPQYENHLLFKGKASELPTDKDIIILVGTNIGKRVNQIVDFTWETELTPSTVISRVATIYQPSQSAAAQTDRLLQSAREQLGNPRIVTEQVLAVGEFK